MKYDLTIAYRIYPKISKIPPAFPTDKFKLSKLCLESFKKSTEGLRIKIYALLDGCPKEYEEIFKENFKAEDLEILNLENIGNKKTFKKQIEILVDQNDSDIVYFAEDDYFYIKDIKNMVDFLKSGQADFVTPYEHPACYDGSHIINNEVRIFNKQRYTTVQHACLTFMTTKKNLLKNKRYISIFSDWFGSDFVVWGSITLGLSYFKYIKLLFSLKNYRLETFKVYGSLFIFALHRFVFNKKYKLFMPINTFATHMESNCLSPIIDWDMYFKDKK
jgi:hypothetical protein